MSGSSPCPAARSQNPPSLSGVARAAAQVMREHGLATSATPVLLMVSGGSDSTALAYVADELRAAGLLGPLAVLHVNHRLRGEDANEDARFVETLARLLNIPLVLREIDVAAEAARTGGNVEAVARRVRYAAADEALRGLCLREGVPVAEGRIFTAHTADDRAENFYMRSIVGTGPGGFRSMRYLNGSVARPLLDASRDELRAYLEERAQSGMSAARDAQGRLWREDATNAHTDRFRAYVRHEIIPCVKRRNPRLLDVLGRTMNLIADEDDFMESLANDVAARCVTWLGEREEDGFLLAPSFGREPAVLQRRVCLQALRNVLGPDARIETASIQAVLSAYASTDATGFSSALAKAGRVGQAAPMSAAKDARAPEETSRAGLPIGGYVANIQGNLAVSANKHGVRIEPMAAFRARRKRG